jgi:membrane protease YdiL (CAAX protease family)
MITTMTGLQHRVFKRHVAVVAILLLLACQWTTSHAFLVGQTPPTTSVKQPKTVGKWIFLPTTVHSRHWLPQDKTVNTPHRNRRQSFFASHSKESPETETNDYFFDGRTTAALIGGQSLLIVASVAVAALIGTPNFGFGPGIAFTPTAISTGVLLSLPLGILAPGLDLIEDKFPALQDVTKATQKSVLFLLGSKFKPLVAFVLSLALGCVAGFGEEMLFRGVLQFELSSRIGQGLAIGISSVIFGALHAVTPLYAFLASLASVYFGATYLYSGNLAVPIVAHTFYDLVALLFAHWTVSRLSDEEQVKLSEWKGPGDV